MGNGITDPVEKNDPYLLSKLVNGGNAVDEPRILLDLFAYFGQSVLEPLEHGATGARLSRLKTRLRRSKLLRTMSAS
jgi:hypothetical protein